MELVKLGRSGQVAIPRAVLRELGIDTETMLLVEVTPDGGILLRPAGVYPVEIYSAEREAEFRAEDRLTAKEKALLRDRRPRRRA